MRNLAGQTSFAAALIRKNNVATALILKKDSKAAEQTDAKGRNFLHLAVMGADIETVLSLLSVRVNVNSRVQDGQAKSPLHLAIESGNEMIVRNLLLAGANINDVTNGTKRTALHLLAECLHTNCAAICSILLENGADANALDSAANNPLHIAVQTANLPVVKVLLAASEADVYALNAKGMSPLHVLAVNGRENSSAILDLFKECIRDFNLDLKDSKGNTGKLT